MTLSQTLPRAWKAFKENKKYLILTILFEFLFLFAMVKLHYTFFQPSAEAATRAGDVLTEEAGKLTETEMYQLESLVSQNEEFMNAYKDLLKNIGMFIIGMLIAWIAFKGPVWHLSQKSIYKKMPLKTSLWKFTWLSLFWFLLICIAFSIYSISTGSTATILPIVSSTATSVIMLIIFAAIFYFSQISFALIPAQQTFKKTFLFGVKYAKTILPAFIINAIIAFIVLTLPFNWIETHAILSLAIILFITIPALAFARIHMIIATWYRKSDGFSAP